MTKYDQCEAMAGGDTKNAPGWRCLRRAVGSFDATIHSVPVRLCTQHAKKYAVSAAKNSPPTADTE